MLAGRGSAEKINELYMREKGIFILSHPQFHPEKAVCSQQEVSTPLSHLSAVREHRRQVCPQVHKDMTPANQSRGLGLGFSAGSLPCLTAKG